jgi:four helix bundle protein
MGLESLVVVRQLCGMQDFRRLRVWQGAHALALSVYRSTAAFPSVEQRSLVSQMRRSALSVCSNIAEGAGRGGDKEFGRFVIVAIGSLSELHAQALLARDLGYLPGAAFVETESGVEALRRQLISLRRALNRNGSQLRAQSTQLGSFGTTPYGVVPKNRTSCTASSLNGGWPSAD